MSGNHFQNHQSLLDEIKTLVKGNEDLNALISEVLKKRRTLTNSLRPVVTGSSTERPKQILMASSTESCNAVPPDELSMSPAIAIENITARMGKVILSDVDCSPFSNSFCRNTKLRAYEDSADDEASSDDSGDSLFSWLTINSSDEDSKYPSTLDDDYDDDSSFDESNESGSVYEESLRLRSSGGGKDRNGNDESVDECDCKSKQSTTESNSEIEGLKAENKNASSDDSRESDEKSSDSSKTVDSCNEETKDCSSAESNSEIEATEGKNKSTSSDDSSESDDRSSDSSKTVNSCNEKANDRSFAESNSEIEAKDGENKSASSDDSSESDDRSSDSSKTVDSCNEEAKDCGSAESNSEIEAKEGENKSVSSDDSSESDDSSSVCSKTVDYSNEEANDRGSAESNSEIEAKEGENKSASSDDSSESDDRSSDSSKTVDSCDEELKHYSSPTESCSDIECGIRSDDSSFSCVCFQFPIAKIDSDSTDSSTSVSYESSDSSEAKIAYVNQSESQQSSNSESGDKVWIELRGRLSSDWGESSLIQSDDSLVCMKAGKDQLIISKRKKTGEIQDIYTFPAFPKWRESSTSRNESKEESDSKATPEALPSSEESEPPSPDAAEKSKLVKKIHRQHKRCKHGMVDQLKERESTSSDVNFLESMLTGAMDDSISTSSSDESENHTEMSPSYKKYSSISEDLSPRNELNNGQSEPQSHKSNTYRKYKDVDERM